MTNTHEIIPGILEQEWGEIEKKFEIIRPFAHTVHIDLIDGKFAPNTTFLDPLPFKNYSEVFFLELHLMVENPIEYIQPFAQVGFKRFLGHIEHMNSQEEFITHAQKYGEGGLCLDGPTSTEEILVPFDTLDALLVYTADHVGFSGPNMEASRLDKVRTLREHTSIPLEVDGGVNDETLLKAKDAGATRFTATSFIFSHDNPFNQFQTLTALL